MSQAIIEIIAKAEDAIKNLGSLQDVLDGVAEHAGALAQAFTALGLAKGLIDLAANITEITKVAGVQAQQLDQLSQRTGVSRQNMQEWSVALRQANLGPQDLALGMKTLSQQIQQSLDPASQAATKFQQLGVVLAGTEAPADVIRVIAERIKLLPDGFEKSAIMTALFGRAGQNLIPLFNGGADAIDKAAAASQRMGAVLRDDQISALTAADDAFSRNAIATESWNSHVGAAFAASVKWYTDLKTQAIVLATQGFDLLVAAAEKVATRLLALVQVGAVVFATNLSKEGIAQSLAAISAINDKTAATLKAIDAESAQTVATVKSVREITAAGEAAFAQAEGQERLGQKILIANAALNRHTELLLGSKAAATAVNLSGLFGQTITPAMVQQQQDAGDRIVQASMLQRAAMVDDFGTKTIDEAVRVSGIFEEVFTPAMLQTQLEAGNQIVRQAMLDRATAINEFGKAAVETAERLSATFDKAVTPFDVVDQEQAGLQLQSMFAEKKRLEDQAAGEAKARADALMTLQSELYQNEMGFIGAADAARRVSFTKVDADYDQQRLAQQRLFDAGTISAGVYYERLENLEMVADAQRMAAVRQFPTFWEQQLQAIVNSNAFSLGTIVSTWTSSIAQVIVVGGNFKQAWQSTQQAIIQAALNTGIQELAIVALAALRQSAVGQALAAAKIAMFGEETSAHTAMETAKTAATTAAETARLGITLATNKASMAAAIASLGTIGAVGEAALGVLEAVILAVGSVFEAIAAGLAASVVGSPFAPGFLAAGAIAVASGQAGLAISAGAIQAAIGTAIAATTAALGVPAFASGGAVFGPTLALVGENATHSNPEFIGHASQLGLGSGGGQQTIIVQLDGREVARNTLKYMPGLIYLKTGKA